MLKSKTSRKQKRSSKGSKKIADVLSMKPIKLKSKKGISKIDPAKKMQNEHFIMAALLECFKDNDSDALIEILDGYLAAQNKSEFAKRSNIARSTLYDMLHGNKNPTLRVFTQCIHELVS